MNTRFGAIIVAILLIASACTSADSGEPAPAMTPQLSAQLRARAFMRACQDVACSGAPILAPDSTPSSVREAIVELFTDEVEYLSDSQLEERYPSSNRYSQYPDGATWFNVTALDATRRIDVVGVDVWISRGQFDVVGQTYLFLWDGTRWLDTSPDAVDVTVTTSVS